MVGSCSSISRFNDLEWLPQGPIHSRSQLPSCCDWGGEGEWAEIREGEGLEANTKSREHVSGASPAVCFLLSPLHTHKWRQRPYDQ